MNSGTHELQVVQAFSALTIPEQIVRDSNIGELIEGMVAETKSVKVGAKRLDELRQEMKDSNFVSNLWNGQDEKVKAAQLDLNQAMGRLTQRSSQLLVVNTAISKVLSDQQKILLEQQELLAAQAHELRRQNEKILEQQDQLAEQQKGLIAANQGLMEAKGITQEHAMQLVGCVTRIMEAEGKIEAANLAMRSALKNDMQEVVAQCDEHVRDALTDTQKQLQTHIQATSTALATYERTAVEAATVASQAKAQQKVLESTVARLLGDQAKGARQSRIALAIVACVAVLSLGWQVVQHFLVA
jgi:hypothetical protein